jgi:hypothetical protein
MRSTVPIIAALLAGCGVDHASTAGALAEPPAPYCLGRELGITQLQAAEEFSWNFCALHPPEVVGYCHEEMIRNLCFGDCTAILCGDQLDVYEQCLEDTQRFVIPDYCWELTGWNLDG